MNDVDNVMDSVHDVLGDDGSTGRISARRFKRRSICGLLRPSSHLSSFSAGYLSLQPPSCRSLCPARPENACYSP